MQVPSEISSLTLSETAMLRMIYDREAEIEKFKQQTYWTIAVRLKAGSRQMLDAPLFRIKGEKPYTPDHHHVKAIVVDLKKQAFSLKQSSECVEHHVPPPPFCRITLKKNAAEWAGLAFDEIDSAIENLCEPIPIGHKSLLLVSRTTTIPDDILGHVRVCIFSDYGKDYLPSRSRPFLSFHDFLIPADLNMTPKKVKRYLDKACYTMYRLIWYRFSASQMKDAISRYVCTDICAGPEERYLFRCESREILSRGYLQAFDEYSPKDIVNSGKPKLRPGVRLELVEIVTEKVKTERPSPYRLVELLEQFQSRNIFDRETAPEELIETLRSKEKIDTNDRYIHLTKDGLNLGKFISEKMPDFFDSSYREQLDSELYGNLKDAEQLKRIIERQHEKLNGAFAALVGGDSSQKDSVCPLCGQLLEQHAGPEGAYIACKKYPVKCKYAKLPVSVHTELRCARCGGKMMVKSGKFGQFMACSGFPKCRHTQPLTFNVTCPAEGCNGNIIQRKTSKGKAFYGCSNFPACKFCLWYRPANLHCPDCHGSYLVLVSRERGDYYKCRYCENIFSLELYPLRKARTLMRGR